MTTDNLNPMPHEPEITKIPCDEHGYDIDEMKENIKEKFSNQDLICGAIHDVFGRMGEILKK